MTIFIILGVFLVLVMMLLFSLRSVDRQSTISLNKEGGVEIEQRATLMKTYLDSCLEGIGEKAIRTVGFRGGRGVLVEPHFENEVVSTNYIFQQGENVATGVDEVEEEIENLVEREARGCLERDDEGQVVDFGLVFDGSKIESEVNLEEGVLLTVRWPILVTQEGAQKEVREFGPYHYDVDLRKFIGAIEGFSEAHGGESVDVLHFLRENVSYEMISDEGEYVFLLYDNDSVLNYEPFSMLVAVGQ